jgi:hypothetical protein
MSTKKNTARIETLVMKPSEVSKVIQHFASMQKQRSLFIWGPPGISKSSVIAQVAKELGYDFVDVRLSQMDPTDLRGIPHPVKEIDEKTGKEVSGMRWSAPLVLPRDPKAKAFILLDEFNSAAPSVQAGAYQLILDRKLGEYTVPEGCVIIAAGNRENDKGITFRMPTPIANRFVHIEMKHDFDDWQRWALNANVDQYVVGFLSAFKHELFNFDANSASRGFQTPRTWEFVSDILPGSEKLPELVLMGLVAGCVGDAAAAQFMEYRKNAADLPASSDILNGKVTKLKRNDVSLCYALTTALCYELRDNYVEVERNGKKAADHENWLKQANNFIGFMLENFNPEVCIMGAKTALSVFRLRFEAKKMPNFDTFTKQYKDLIMN